MTMLSSLNIHDKLLALACLLLSFAFIKDVLYISVYPCLMVRATKWVQIIGV
jgi:hypothetical protein